MLEPALAHKDELVALFAKLMYSNSYYLYNGYPYSFELPKIDDAYGKFHWAIMDADKLIGYFSYRVDPSVSCASQFGLFSFDPGNPIIGINVYHKMNELICKYHRIEWYAVEGNPVTRHYDKLCKRYHGRKLVLYDATKDADGHYRNSIIYEIINDKDGNGNV